ncbi:MAG: IS630 family transposase [Chloroflexota bacterium]
MARGFPPSRTSRPRLRAHWRFPPALDEGEQAGLKTALQAPPREAGLNLADWNWKVVWAFIQQRCHRLLCRGSCLNYLHRLGFVVKRPKKRLLKANAEKREAFVAFYAALLAQTRVVGAKVFFVDEAHFRTDADLRGKWVLRGKPALVDSTSPARKEKVTYYSGVCLETGEVETMEVAETCTAETSAAFLRQLREKHPEPLIVIWDNGPAHHPALDWKSSGRRGHGEAIRTYLSTADLRLRLVALPGYSPDFNADEAIWDCALRLGIQNVRHWARDEVTANTCLGTKARVREKMGQFFRDLSERTAEAKQRCRTVLQAKADALDEASSRMLTQSDHVDPNLALV